MNVRVSLESNLILNSRLKKILLDGILRQVDAKLLLMEKNYKLRVNLESNLLLTLRLESIQGWSQVSAKLTSIGVLQNCQSKSQIRVESGINSKVGVKYAE